ncbi:MAG: hypothetical protein M3O30_08405 [Planctomycetota bacterium]|nr:hypothetical protein [Planctomycetota bacterium]
MADVSNKARALDYAPPAPKKCSVVRCVILAIFAGLLGAPPFVFGLIGIFPPYYDINGPVAFNGEVVFNMSALMVVGFLFWFLSFRWARMAMKKL